MRPDLFGLSLFFCGFALVCWIAVLSPRLRGRIGWRGNGTRMSTPSLIGFALLPTCLALASFHVWIKGMIALFVALIGFLVYSHGRDVAADRRGQRGNR